MIKKILIATILALAGFNIYKKFFKKENTEKVFYLETPCAPGSLDPSSSDGDYECREIGKVYEGLLSFHYLKRPFELVPELAEEMPTVSEDGLTYTFKIKKGVYFHNNKCFANGKGRELTAEDFVFSIKRAADPKTQSPTFALLSNRIAGLDEWRDKNKDLAKTDYSEEVEGLKAIDKYTLQFKLKGKWPQFLMILSMPVAVAIPKEAVDYYGNTFGYHPVGTGPFIIEEYKPQENRIVAIKNTNYREKYYPTEASKELEEEGFLKYAGKRIPFVDKVVTVVITENQPRWLKFANAHIDLVDLRGMSDMDSKVVNNQAAKNLSEKGIIFKSRPRLCTSFIFLNNNVSPFKGNKYLRQAISLAMDRSRANELIYEGRKSIATSIIPPGGDGFDENFENPYAVRNIEKAKELMVKAGYPNGDGLPEIEMFVSGDPTSMSFAELFKENMRAIGIKITLKPTLWAEKRNLTSAGKYEIHSGGWISDYPDSENFFSLFYNGNYLEYSGFNNKEFNELYDVATKMQPCEERIELYKKLNAILCEECPGLVIFYEPAEHMHYSWVKNFVHSDPSHVTYFKYIDIDMEEKAKYKK